MEINLVSPNGTGVITNDIRCLPSPDRLEAMVEDGFKVFIDGSKLNKSEVKALIKEMTK